MSSDHRRESGVALLIVLWMVALLAILAITFANSAHTELEMARNQLEAARARSLADAGVSLVLLRLIEPVSDTIIREDGTAMPFRFGDGSLSISMQNEDGKIDLNAASTALLRRLFQVVGLADDDTSQLAISITAWRTEQLRKWNTRAPGDTSQNDRKPPIEAFRTLEDLRQVPGMTAALFRRIAPFVTVYSHSSAIDPLTAPQDVLESLPELNPRAVQALVTARAAAAPIPGTLPMLNDPDGTAPHVTATTLTIRSQGTTAAGASFVREAVVRLTRDPKNAFQILAWRQGMAPETPPIVR
jgi:general secretion pathway protein K